jgi:hypothetical protein
VPKVANSSCDFRDKPNPPPTGWRPIRAIDLRATSTEPGNCERCGRHDLRFLHTVAHPTEGELQVGCECARRLCYGYSPEREETRLRNLWARQNRWLTRNWGRSQSGNETLKFKHEEGLVRVTIFAGKFGGWNYCIGFDGKAFYGARPFQSSGAAKLGAFDHFADAAQW